MAANLLTVKRVVNQIKIAGGGRDPIPATRRWMQVSTTYDKNKDDQDRANVVPDDVIQPQSDRYWGPNPQTGVFGPADTTASGERKRPSPASGNGGSAPDLAAWFRPLEDVEKPPPS